MSGESLMPDLTGPRRVAKGGTPVEGLYCDGGVIGSSRSPVGGTWAWCLVSADGTVVRHESSVIVPTAKWPTITNNYSEYVAAVRALEAMTANWAGVFCTDSLITIGRLFYAWSMLGIPDPLVRRGDLVLGRLGKVHPLLLDGHPTRAQLRAGVGKRGNPVSVWNVWCDRQCNRVKELYATAGLSTTPQDATGATRMAQEAR